MSDDDEFLIDVKFKKSNKQFKQIHLKKKTEICLNYLYKGHCKYSENCSFAHGDAELKARVNLSEGFKTKPCKNYHKMGGCPYGTRCQYLHSEIKEQIKWWGYLRKQCKKHDIPYTFAWDKTEKVKPKDLRVDLMRFQRVYDLNALQQLPYFRNLCQ